MNAANWAVFLQECCFLESRSLVGKTRLRTISEQKPFESARSVTFRSHGFIYDHGTSSV